MFSFAFASSFIPLVRFDPLCWAVWSHMLRCGFNRNEIFTVFLEMSWSSCQFWDAYSCRDICSMDPISGNCSMDPISGIDVNKEARRFKAEGRAQVSDRSAHFNNGPNTRCQHQLNGWAYVPPGWSIGPNIVSTGLRFKTPRDSALPLPSMLRLFEHIITAVASGPPGTGSTIQQPGRDVSGFPLSPLISYSCAIADGDLMGVLEGLRHSHPVRVWQEDFFFFFLNPYSNILLTVK